MSRFSSLEMGSPAPEGDADANPSTDADARPDGPARARPTVRPLVSNAPPPRNARFHMAEAERLFLAGAQDKALTAYSAALSDNPVLVEAWTGQLLMLADLEEYHEARVWADTALGHFPDHPDLLAVKALALWRMAETAAAHDLVDAALERRQDSEHVWRVRGELFLKRGAAGEGCLAKSLEYAKNAGIARLRVGKTYLDAKRHRPALEHLKDAVERLPKSAWAWFLLGRAQEALGWNPAARASYEAARNLSPGDRRYIEAANKGGRSWLGGLFGWLRR